jgi:TrmH family RNA methyltransferase
MERSILKYAQSLKLRKKRESEGKFLIEGVKLTLEAVKTGADFDFSLYTQKLESSNQGKKLIGNLVSKAVKVYKIKSGELEKISETVNSQGIVSVVRKKRWNQEQILNAGNGLVLVIDRLQDPGNVGTIVRTAHAASVCGIFALRGTAEFCNPKVVRGTAGSIFHIPFVESVEPAQIFPLLREHGFETFGLESGRGEDFYRHELPDKCAMVVGNEGAGLSMDVRMYITKSIHVPLRGGVESLNAAVAAGIVMYHYMLR